MLYGIETAPDGMVSIDRGLWRGDIRLIPSRSRTTADRGVMNSATLAADAAIQGIPCRAGMLVEFSEYGGDLQHCTLMQRIGVTAEIDEGQGGKSTKDLVCAANWDVWLRTFERRFLERCVLAETATIGTVVCAGVVLSGDGLDTCTLASAQRVGPFDLLAGTLVVFIGGRLDKFEMPTTSAPFAANRLRSRFAPDSPLERERFEPSVPR
jgi:hypothetical protein